MIPPMKQSLAGIILLAAAITACNTSAPPPQNDKPFSVVEATIPEMQKAMQEGRTSSRKLSSSIWCASRFITTS
jgi:hypothetical protein